MRRDWAGSVEGTAGVRLKSPHFNDLAYTRATTLTPVTAADPCRLHNPELVRLAGYEARGEPQKVLK